MQRLETEVVRISNADFYADLASVETEALRQLKEQAEAVESMVSYARRMVQGRLDTFSFDPVELGTDASSPNAEGVLLLSSAIVSGTTAPSGFGRFVDTTISDAQVDEVQEEIDTLVKVFSEEIRKEVSENTSESEVELAVYRRVEQELSEWRKVLFLAIDAIRAELVVRYRGDSAMVDELLAKVIGHQG